MTPENLAKVDDYLNITSRLKRETLYFFDEASVIGTSGNSMFGSGYRGQLAIQVQRYASNANLTVNLRLCSLNKRKSVAVALNLYLYKNFRHFQSFEREIFN